MTGVASTLVASASSKAASNTQTVTPAQTGTNPNRLRGYKSTATAQGSITPGILAIYSAPITEMYFDESVGNFILTVAGATDSGWTTMTNSTDSTSLTRASRASFSGGTWTWTGQTIAAFFATGSGAKTITFT